MVTLIIYDIKKVAFYKNIKRIFYYNLSKYKITEGENIQRILKSTLLLHDEKNTEHIINIIKTMKSKYGDDAISAYVIKGNDMRIELI